MSTHARQQVYDRVAAHLRVQGRQSLDANGCCAYRGEGGLRCAIGIFIDDANYNAEMEGKAVESLFHLLLPEVASTGPTFLCDIQMLHDVGVRMVDGTFYAPDLEHSLQEMCAKWALIYSEPASRG